MTPQPGWWRHRTYDTRDGNVRRDGIRSGRRALIGLRSRGRHSLPELPSRFDLPPLPNSLVEASRSPALPPPRLTKSERPLLGFGCASPGCLLGAGASALASGGGRSRRSQPAGPRTAFRLERADGAPRTLSWRGAGAKPADGDALGTKVDLSNRPLSFLQAPRHVEAKKNTRKFNELPDRRAKMAAGLPGTGCRYPAGSALSIAWPLRGQDAFL